MAIVSVRLKTEQENGEYITGEKASSSQSWLLYGVVSV